MGREALMITPGAALEAFIREHEYCGELRAAAIPDSTPGLDAG